MPQATETPALIMKTQVREQRLGCFLLPLDDADFQPLALAIRRARAIHPFFLTAWVFLPDQRRMRSLPRNIR